MILFTEQTGLQLVMPNPKLGDGERHANTVTVRRAMDGTVRTIIQKRSAKVLRWTFELTRIKALEVQDYIKKHGHKKLDILGFGYNGVGYFLTSPTELEMVARWASQCSDGHEKVNFSIEFELQT